MKGDCSIYTLSAIFTAINFSTKNFPRKQGFLTAALFKKELFLKALFKKNKYFSIYIYMFIGNRGKNEIALNNAYKDSSSQILIPAGAFG